MRAKRIIAAAGAAVLGLAMGGLAQAAQVTRPATSQVAGEQLTATVASVKGSVQIRNDETKPWRVAKVGEQVPVGAECRTGPRSSIVLTMPSSQTITLDRLGVVKILEAFRTAGKLKTDLGMSYGRVRYQIEAPGLEHESTIRSPSSALAIRGTDVTYQDGAFGYDVTLNKGLVDHIVNGHTYSMGTGGEDSYGDNPPRSNDEEYSAAEYANKHAGTSYADSHALTPDEQDVVSDVTPIAGLNAGFFSLRKPRGVTEPGTGPTTGEDFVLGKLSFNLSWAGDRASGVINPDLDLFVISSKGEKLVALDGKPFSVPSGGVISPNDRGGKGATIGIETAAWETSYPIGQYQYGVHYNGKGDPATFKVIVLQDGKQINSAFDDTVTEDDPDVSFRITVQAPAAPQGSQTGAGGTEPAPKTAVARRNQRGNAGAAPAAASRGATLGGNVAKQVGGRAR